MDVTGTGVDLPVTLVIKAPSQRQDDQVVDCVLSWTVRKLKEHLETVYPSKPKSNEQRLIYSGKLLQDENTLKDVLRQYDSEATDNRYTLHLVCSSNETSSSAKQNEKVKKKNPVSRPSSSSQANTSRDSTINNNGNTFTTTTSADGLRHRGFSHSNAPPTWYPGVQGYGGFPMGAYNPYMADANAYNAAATQAQGYSPEQYAVMMQQMYSQYMMQYMQYYQHAYNPTDTPPSPGLPYMQQQFPAPWAQPEMAAAPAEVIDGGAAAANNQPAAPRQNMRRMNAQGGMEDEEEDGEPRDWLHHTYTIMRFLTFLGILFFYSNMSRFLIVFAGSFLIFFLQKFRKYLQQRDRNQQQDGEVNQQQQNQETPLQDQQDGSGNAEDVENESDGDNTNQSPHENEETVSDEQNNDEEQNQGNLIEEEGNRLTRALVFAANTLQAFFTSLLPTPPDLLEAN